MWTDAREVEKARFLGKLTELDIMHSPAPYPNNYMPNPNPNLNLTLKLNLNPLNSPLNFWGPVKMSPQSRNVLTALTHTDTHNRRGAPIQPRTQCSLGETSALGKIGSQTKHFKNKPPPPPPLPLFTVTPTFISTNFFMFLFESITANTLMEATPPTLCYCI